MNEVDNRNSGSAQDGSIAPATKRVKGKSGFSPIWIIPIVALLIGAYLIYRTVSESGPTITITFKEAPGMEAGKTKIKYKDVIVGSVTGVDLSDDARNVVLTAEMGPKSKKFLNDKTRFWVVSPQISSGGISGLGTLLSGNYLGMDPSEEGKETSAFIGLDQQPVIQSTEAGSHFTLSAKRLFGVNVSSPVFYKDIQVGQVIDYQLESDDSLTLGVFIQSPYDKRVNNATRFWNASGFNVNLTANGLDINTESLVSIIAGGIAFGTVPYRGRDASKPPAADQVFNLYASRSKSREPTYKDKHRLLLYFSDSIRGLLPGAPVEMRGYQVGEVVDVTMEYNHETGQFRLPVLIDIEPERISVGSGAEFKTAISALVKRGLRGQLKSGNLVLGKLLVELDIHPDAPAAVMEFGAEYPVLPTVQDTMTEIVNNAGALITELRQTASTINGALQSKDFKNSAKDLTATIANVKQLTTELEQTTAPELAKVLVTANATLTDAQSMLATNATTRTELNRLLSELGEAARSIRLLADYLEQHPESIIKGKEK